MKQQNIAGYIVRLNQAKDADILLQLITDKGLLINAYAKGAKKPLSRKSYALDLLNLVAVRAEQKGDLYFVNEIRLIENTRSQLTSLHGLLALQCLCEIASKFALFAEESVDLYLDLVSAARSLNDENNANLVAAFMLKLLSQQGVLPNLKIDNATQTAITIYFGFVPGEVGYKDGTGRLIDDRIVKSQLFLLNADLEHASKLKLTVEEQQQMLEIVADWVASYLGEGLKSILSFINSNK